MSYVESIRMGHPSRQVPDDQVTVDSLAYSDDFTLPGDEEEDYDDDYMSDTTVSATESYGSFAIEEQLPSYHVPRDESVQQPVYEAWILRYTGDNKEVVNGTKLCGINAIENYDQLHGYVDTRPEPYDQADLRAMHVAAIDRYQVAHKRSMPSRLVRGRAKSYEQALDNNVRKLPASIQKEINILLGDREVATSTRLHQRDWTVVMMREQFHYRFGDSAFEEVKRHRVRFWKNPDRKQPIEYLVVLRGAEGRTTTDDKGWATPRRHSNPWKNVDDTERRTKERMKRMKGYEKETLKAPRIAIRRRSFPPPPLRYHQSYLPPTPRPFNEPTPRPRSVSPPPPPPLVSMERPYVRPCPRPHISYGPPLPPGPLPVPAPTPQFQSYPRAPFQPCYTAYVPPGIRCGMPAAPPPQPPPMPMYGVNSYGQPIGQLPNPVNFWNPPSPPNPPPAIGVYQPPTIGVYPSPTIGVYPPASIPYMLAGPPMRPPPGMGGMPICMPPPQPPMGMSPPRFPPPAPMPSNLTTPTFTATASERSGARDTDKESTESISELGEMEKSVDGDTRRERCEMYAKVEDEDMDF